MPEITQKSVSIRLLTPQDAPDYCALRLRALMDHPEAFTSSAEEEAGKPLSWSEDRLKADANKPHDLFLGAFLDDKLVGMVGLQGRYRPKERHNATVVGMFVAPEAGGPGLGLALVRGPRARGTRPRACRGRAGWGGRTGAEKSSYGGGGVGRGTGGGGGPPP